MITIETPSGLVKFPTSFDEVTSEKLAALTEPIVVNEKRTVLGLCKICNLNSYALRINNQGKLIGASEKNISVIPFIAKSNNPDFKAGSVAIIATSEIERANHISAPINPSELTLLNTLKVNDEFRKAIIRKECKDDDGNIAEQVMVLSFVIVNDFNIAATIPLHYNIENPFLSTSKE